MRIIGVDLHTQQQSLAMLNTETGELIEKTLEHDSEKVRKFYSALPGQVLVGIEATGPMRWFLKLMEDLEIGCQVGSSVEGSHYLLGRLIKNDLLGCVHLSLVDA